MKSDLFPTLADIFFAERDPATIERNIIRGYEDAFQLQYGEERRLFPGDPIRLHLETIAFEVIVLRQLIDHTGKMNLLAYASGDFLDHLGIWLGVRRLPAQSALTTLKFALSTPQAGVSVIPAGTRATPGGGDIIFATSAVAEIPEGANEVKVPAHCLVSGVVGNGFVPGQVRRIVDPFPWQMNVENVTVSAGGVDIENDENLRERIHLAPEAFSNAGSKGAYIFWARSASQLIVDVEVSTPSPGVVHIYSLLAGGGLPSQELLNDVLAKCNDDTIRPMTDHVFALPPDLVEYDLRLIWFLERARATSATSITNAVEQAANSWILWQKMKLGRDINPSELIKRVVAAGAKRVSEAELPPFTVLDFNQVAVCASLEVIFGGIEDG